METNYSAKKAIRAGTIGGIVAGAVMIVSTMLVMSVMNLPPDFFPTIIGMTMDPTQQSAAIIGIAVHFIPSVIIGVIFGVMIRSSKLTITSFKKGILLGISVGVISYLVIFLPMIMTGLHSPMVEFMQIINPELSNEEVMQKFEGVQPMILVGSFIAHIIYGIVLGAVTFAMLKRTKKEIYS